MITHKDAVIELAKINHPNSGLYISGKCESDLSGVKLTDGVSLSFTFDDVLAKKKELQADYDSKQYQRDRIYPPIGDQLDALYHAGVFPKEMADKLKAVKDAHPKPK